MAERSSGAGMDITKESAGVDALSAGARTNADISNQGQFQSSPMYRISWTGPSHIITGRAGIISRPLEISSLLTGMRMGPEIM